jgi:hypothetical protein
MIHGAQPSRAAFQDQDWRASTSGRMARSVAKWDPIKVAQPVVRARFPRPRATSGRHQECGRPTRDPARADRFRHDPQKCRIAGGPIVLFELCGNAGSMLARYARVSRYCRAARVPSAPQTRDGRRCPARAREAAQRPRGAPAPPLSPPEGQRGRSRDRRDHRDRRDFAGAVAGAYDQ